MGNKTEKDVQAYRDYVKTKTPVHGLPLNMVKAFLTGGAICTLGEFILNYAEKMGLDKDTSASWCCILLIFLSVLLTGVNLYGRIAKWGGAGALVPITGFANSVAAPAIEYKKEGQVMGIGCKIFTIAGPVILYGIFTSSLLGLLWWIAKEMGDSMIQKTMGAQSLAFTEAPCIISSASVVGKKESEGPLGDLFDVAGEDDLFGEKTWEEAESRIQKEACVLALGKAHVGPDQVRYLYGGDLLRQGIATSMGAEELQIPMFGLFGACSTSGEALALASMSAAAGYGEYMLAVTSSHFGTAEKEFRFPLSYASQRPLSAQWTVTGSAAFLVSSRPGPVRIAGVTVGKIVDFGLKDSQNMGACMAPAAADTIACSLEDFGREAQEYDRIITGDLGYVGQSILLDLMRERGHRHQRLRTWTAASSSLTSRPRTPMREAAAAAARP